MANFLESFFGKKELKASNPNKVTIGGVRKEISKLKEQNARAAENKASMVREAEHTRSFGRYNEQAENAISVADRLMEHNNEKIGKYTKAVDKGYVDYAKTMANRAEAKFNRDYPLAPTYKGKK